VRTHPGNRPTAIPAGPGHHRRAFALVWAAMRRDVAEIAFAGVVGLIACNATASLGAAALARPLAVAGALAPAIAAGVLPLALLVAAPAGGWAGPPEPPWSSPMRCG
jgi:hypothetical protein